MRLAYPLAFLLILGGPAAAAQDAGFPLGLTVRVAPLGVVNKARGHAELGLGPQVGVGVVGSYYYAGNFQGTKLEPYARFYFSRQRFGHGFYGQVKLSTGRYTSNFEYNRTVTTYRADGFLDDLRIENPYGRVRRSFRSTGGGAGAGYQFRAGRSSRFVIDVYAGLQFLPLPADIGDHTTTSTDASGRRTVTDWTTFDDVELWYLTGPGSVLNGMVSVGYTLGGGRRLAPVDKPDRPRRPTRPAAPPADEPIRKAALRRSVPLAAAPFR